MPTKKTADAGGVFNLDEVTDDRPDFRFTFGGREFTFPGHPDILWIDLVSKGAFHQALLLLLGQEQFDALDALDVTLDDTRFKALIERYNEHLGVDSGKSSGPSRSSALTRNR